MLTNATVSVPARFSGTVIVTAGIHAVTVENVERDGDNVTMDLSGRTERVKPFLRHPSVEVLSTIDSVPGEPEGFGLLTDIADGSQVNYGSLMAMPR